MSTTFIKRAATGAVAVSLAFSALVAGGTSASATNIATRTSSAAVDSTYLQSVSPDLPANNVIETVTYDRFQWLLRQPGQFAFVVGSASDSGFAANLVKVDTAAKAAHTTKVYWFDPNLTGQTGLAKNLDVRNTSGINLAAASQAAYKKIWQNVLGKYLGNGIKVVQTNTTTVTITTGTPEAEAVVNDAVDPIWDYRSTNNAPQSTTDDFFFTYDKEHVSGPDADKIVSWVDLSTNSDVTAALGVALTAIGGNSIDELDQFQWWKDSANTKHKAGYAGSTSDSSLTGAQRDAAIEADRIARYGNEVLTDADDDNGWVIKQITYPELLHLLEIQDRSDRNFVILFGGTWCHNTRAVLKQVNQNALENGVTTVYNFDLVLDGGTVNGSNGSANPIHVRAAANSGTTFNFRPSWAYGDVVRKYFKNLVTEYDPHTGAGVTYYPGGDLAVFPDVVRKLQVPFLINYQHGNTSTPSTTSIKRQWIQRNVDTSTGLPTYREYMSEQWFTTPSAQLGLSFAIPTDETTLNADNLGALKLARDNKTFAEQALADLNTFFDGLPGYTPTRTLTVPTAGSTTKVTLTLSDLQGRIPNGNVTLKFNGKNYVAAVVSGVATFNTPVQTAGVKSYTYSYVTDSQIAGFTQTDTVTVEKSAVTSVVGAVTKAPTAAAAGKFTVTVTRDAALPKVGGTVTVTLTKGSVTKVINAAVANGVANVVLPKLEIGAWTVSYQYLGDATFAAGSAISLTNGITIATIRR